jgi:hypothetical protein
VLISVNSYRHTFWQKKVKADGAVAAQSIFTYILHHVNKQMIDLSQTVSFLLVRRDWRLEVGQA